MVNIYITPSLLKELAPYLSANVNQHCNFETWLSEDEKEKITGIKNVKIIRYKKTYSRKLNYRRNIENFSKIQEGIYILDFTRDIDTVIPLYISSEAMGKSIIAVLFPDKDEPEDIIQKAYSSLKELLLLVNNIGLFIVYNKKDILVSRQLATSIILSLILLYDKLEKDLIPNNNVLGHFFVRYYLIDENLRKWLEEAEEILNTVSKEPTRYIALYKLKDLRKAYSNIKKFIEKGTKYTIVITDIMEIVKGENNLRPLDIFSKNAAKIIDIKKASTIPILLSSEELIKKIKDLIPELKDENVYIINYNGIYINKYYTIDISSIPIDALQTIFKPYTDILKKLPIFEDYAILDPGLAKYAPLAIVSHINVENIKDLESTLDYLDVISNSIKQLVKTPGVDITEEEYSRILNKFIENIREFTKLNSSLSLVLIAKSKGIDLGEQITTFIDKIYNKLTNISNVLDENMFIIKDNLSLIEVVGKINISEVNDQIEELNRNINEILSSINKYFKK